MPEVMTEREAYIAFNLTARIGSTKVAALAQTAGSVAQAWENFPSKISRTEKGVDIAGELARAQDFGVSIITPADAAYPALLKTMPGYPLALYVKGDVAALAKPSIALVGTRRATAYGRAIAARLAADLVTSGWSVVSGLALGIDAAAHQGALDAKGVTVGVLGSALDQFYPEENRSLARDMVAKGGAVVSEFPFGRPPDKETFPIRNHVVAGLTRAVICIEAPQKSGALLTCSNALDLGRTVMAVPGRIDAPMSAGCNRLIREGATLVTSVDDVLDALSELPLGRPAPKESDDKDVPDPARPAYSVEEAMIMLHLDDEPVSLEDLSRLTKLPLTKVSSLALTLRVKGFVRFLPGNRLART